MSKARFINPKFIKTAVWPKDYPKLATQSGTPLTEIAVVGRSNVGKSALLNHLFARKKMVKTSSTPGKTQALNFFTLNDEMAFVDLPGYGYAKVPEKIKKQWGPMAKSYLENRPTLKLLLFLLDIRRIPNKEDLCFLEWAEYYEIPLILVLTKTDKVKQNEKRANTQKIIKKLDNPEIPFVHYSATKNIGRSQLISKIQEFLWD
jgi:GTP-binding protein